MMLKRFFIFAMAFTLILWSCSTSTKNTEVEISEQKDYNNDWIQLFNGEDLSDWIIKISKHDLNVNFSNTFRVEEGLMKVRYDNYESFDNQFGHIFYKNPYSYYLLKVEYRFVGEQAEGGEPWAIRNSGAMLHAQDPATMMVDQDFPISIEGQMLGGDGENPRPTSNLCTPGTNVVMEGELFTPHCVTSTAKTYHGAQWVTAEFLVLGDSVIHHIMEGEKVLTYYKPQIGGGNVEPFDPSVKVDGQLLKSGYISLQSESHPIDFRKVELFDLAPYSGSIEKLQEVIDVITNK